MTETARPGLIPDILDVLERHGYAARQPAHRPGRRLISYLASSTKAPRPTLRPYHQRPPRRIQARPAGKRTELRPARSQHRLAALDIAAEYKRDLAETCADCSDQSCITCQYRLKDAQVYDRLAAQLYRPLRQPGLAREPEGRRPPRCRAGRPVTTDRKPRPDPPPAEPRPASGDEDMREIQTPMTPFPDGWPRPPRVRDRGRPAPRLAAGAPASSPGTDAPANRSPTWKPNHDPDPEDDPMTLTINDTTMTSDQTAHTARQAPGRPHQWEVSWLPGRVLDRNTAITAMILADIAAEDDLARRPPALAAHPGLGRRTRPDRTRRDRTSLPAAPRPRPPAERASGQPDREAAD